MLEATEPMLTVEQVAAWLQLEPATIRQMVIRKAIPAYKLGRVWRFSRQEICAWLEERSNQRKETDA